MLCVGLLLYAQSKLAKKQRFAQHGAKVLLVGEAECVLNLPFFE